MKPKKKIRIRKIIPKREGKIYYQKKKCKWCDEIFEPINPNHQYCSKICKEEAHRVNNNKRVLKFRKRYSYLLSDWIGTGHLGEHRLESDEKEMKMIEKEMKRLKIYK